MNINIGDRLLMTPGNYTGTVIGIESGMTRASSILIKWDDLNNAVWLDLSICPKDLRKI